MERYSPAASEWNSRNPGQLRDGLGRLLARLPETCGMGYPGAPDGTVQESGGALERYMYICIIIYLVSNTQY